MTDRRPAVAWRWDDALFGLICALPAAVIALSDVPKGLTFAFGVLPGTIVGIAPRRARRGAVVVVGLMMGVSIFAGSLLSGIPALAVASVVGLAVGAAWLAEHRSIGMVVMTLAVPLVAVGFSYPDRGTALGLGVLLVLGSTFSVAVSMAWPERPASVPPARGPAPSLIGYGLRLGIAGAIAAAIGFAADWDHAGWACAACLLVMRPSPDLVTSRGVGRLASVLVGAVVGVALAELTGSGTVYAVAILLVLAATSATHTSRWYVTAAFTTFLVLSLLAYGASEAAATGSLDERVVETALGVALAFVFGTFIPRLSERRAGASG